MKKTLFDKVWDAHVVDTVQDGPQVLYIDKHLIHEVTSPQAFNELVDRNIPVFRPDQIVATADHNTPTLDQHLPVKDELSRKQLAQLSLPAATRYLLQMQAGESPLNTINASAVTDEQVAQEAAPEWLVAHVEKAPTLLVVTVDLALIASMDKDLERVGLVSGGSIYPLAWNILLAARNEGYGGTMTTWGVAEEQGVKNLLGIPPSWAVAAIMPLGKPVKQLTRLKRKPVEEILVTNSWGASA